MPKAVDDDLPALGRVLEARSAPAYLALTHFDLAAYRPSYDVNLFSSLRYLMMEKRKLVLLIQSRAPFDVLLPRDHPLSQMDLKTVELKEV